MSRTTRRTYTGSRGFSPGCRNHGNCMYCAEGRQHKNRRREPVTYQAEHTITPMNVGLCHY